MLTEEKVNIMVKMQQASKSIYLHENEVLNIKHHVVGATVFLVKKKNKPNTLKLLFSVVIDSLHNVLTSLDLEIVYTLDLTL